MSAEGACPYLGTEDDPEIFHAFPSPHNCCYKASDVGIVRAAYQSRYCLSPRHAGCRLYAQPWAGPLPAELAHFEPRARSRAAGPHQGLAFVGILLTAILTLGAWAIFLVGSSDARPPAALMAATSPPPENPSPSRTATPTSRPTQPPTASPSPTASPTPPPTPGPGLETPVAPDMAFLIHEIQPGESMGDLGERFDTNEETIRYLNGIEGWPLWVGEMLVIPVGVGEAGDLPRFTIYQVPGDEVRVQAVADLFEVDIDDLRVYNRLGDGPTLPAGRWLIVPLKSEQ